MTFSRFIAKPKTLLGATGLIMLWLLPASAWAGSFHVTVTWTGIGDSGGSGIPVPALGTPGFIALIFLIALVAARAVIKRPTTMRVGALVAMTATLVLGTSWVGDLTAGGGSTLIDVSEEVCESGSTYIDSFEDALLSNNCAVDISVEYEMGPDSSNCSSISELTCNEELLYPCVENGGTVPAQEIQQLLTCRVGALVIG